MKITFLYGGHGIYEKREEIQWPDGSPVPRVGETVSIELRGNDNNMIDGEVCRISHCLSLKGELKLYIKVE